jgi:hypothetical protein
MGEIGDTYLERGRNLDSDQEPQIAVTVFSDTQGVRGGKLSTKKKCPRRGGEGGCAERGGEEEAAAGDVTAAG